nr:PREDICTED: wolframin isoform X1 [Bemisia tabaci]
MAGFVPLPVKTSARKQWTLHDNRPGGRFKRLGSYLSENGCPDSQVDLGKQLLKENGDTDGDPDEKARLGVYWLIKASEQGHVEATELLKQCLQTGKGITEQNYLDVKACLEMTTEEKVARTAARTMFACLSAGKDFITSEQLSQQMGRLELPSTSASNGGPVPNEDSEEPAPDWRSRLVSGGEKLSEDMLVLAASHYAQGELPIVQRVLTLKQSQEESHRRWNVRYLKHSLTHPLEALESACFSFIEYFGRYQFFRKLLNFSLLHVQIVAILALYSIIGYDDVVAKLPLTLYAVSFAILIVSTCKILFSKRDFHQFRRWSNLFIAYSNENLLPQEAELLYLKNNLRPYIIFFLVLLVNLSLYPFVADELKFYSELTVISFCATFFSLQSFSFRSQSISSPKSFDWLALFSFGVHVLAKYPYETDTVVSQGWRYLDVQVPTFASYVVGNGIEFCLNFRALFYLLIPAVFVRMASRDKWRGIYKSFIPHCVSLAWWQLTLILAQGATWYGLLRCTLALVGFVLFLPLATFASILLPVVAAGKLLADYDTFIRVITTIIVASSPIILSIIFSRWNAARYFVWIQFIMSLMAAMILFATWDQPPATSVSAKLTTKQSLSLAEFQDYCQQDGSSIDAKAKCLQLIGQSVTWDGTVQSVRITNVDNPALSIINKLPFRLRSSAACLFGEKFPMDALKNNELEEKLSNECHVSNWNRYTLNISAQISMNAWQPPTRVSLLAGNAFYNFTRLLKEGDTILFTGILTPEESGLLSPSEPSLLLQAIGCITCHDTSLDNQTIVSSTSVINLSSLYMCLKFILNFVFNPIVIFR